MILMKTKQDIERLEHLLNRFQIRLDDHGEEHFDQEIQDAWQQLKINAGQDNLQKMHVDTLSTLEKRMPINELVNNGYRTIYDLKDMDVHELMNIKGVGEKSAYAIVDGVSRISASIYEQANYRIDPDHLSPDDFKILEAIYKKWHLSKKTATLQKDLDELISNIGSSIKAAKKKKGFFKGLFQSADEKASVILAFRKLNRPEYKQNISRLKNEINDMVAYTVSNEVLEEHFIQENAAYYTEIEKVTGIVSSEGTEDLPDDIIEEVNNFPLDTTGLSVELRKYQTFGAKYALLHKRTLLGDEMGLGKTIQALAMINHLFLNGKRHAIVVCPLSVMANWKREIEQHSDLKTFIFHGGRREKEFEKWQLEAGIILTTYEHTLRMNFEEKDQLDVLVVDEAHYVKNYQLAVRAGQIMMMRRVAWLGGSPEKSPKLQQLLDICEEAYENGQKVLVFSFFKDVISIVQKHLRDKTYEAITGDVSNNRRQEIIDEFTNGPKGSVLVSQITAGGVGLNIQAANIVILCEPQWKPSTEEQAISRAYRMGQSRNVVVYRLLTEESIDESMLELLGEKSELFDLYARESNVAALAAGESEEVEEESLKQKVLEIEQDRIKEEVV